MTEAGIKAFGPTADAAVLEGSKAFTKDFCARHGIPTAAYGRFTEADVAKDYIRETGAPIVVKADGLAAGKVVIIAETVDEALAAVDSMMADWAFGDAGAEIVVEAFLRGEEASFFALVDGEIALPLASAQDHKRVGDGDVGPNTGGMGPTPRLRRRCRHGRTHHGGHHHADRSRYEGGRAIISRCPVRRPDDHRERARTH